MEKEIKRNIRLGIFIVAGVVLLIMALYFIGDNKNIFGSKFKIYTTFRNINGLQRGHNVRFSGIDVGTVNNIEILNDTTIHVEMILALEMKQFIRKNSIASIGTDGLMGNKLLNIDPGTGDSPLVEEGDEIISIRATNTEAMMRTLETTNQNVEAVSANLKSITDEFTRGQGNLYSVLLDTSFSTGINHILSNIKLASDDISAFSGDLNNGNGLAGVLTNDTVMAIKLQASVEKIHIAATNISVLSVQLNEMAVKINNGTGPAALMLNDSITAANIVESIKNIKSSSEKLDEDLEGLQHSFPLKRYFRKQAKLKAKSAEENK